MKLLIKYKIACKSDEWKLDERHCIIKDSKENKKIIGNNDISERFTTTAALSGQIRKYYKTWGEECLKNLVLKYIAMPSTEINTPQDLCAYMTMIEIEQSCKLQNERLIILMQYLPVEVLCCIALLYLPVDIVQVKYINKA
jgi:hypothetical protein